jgi:MFS family permease
MAETALAQQQREGRLGSKGRKAVYGAWFGFFVDMYDIYLPIVVLAPALIYFLSPEIDATTTVIIGGTIFASTLVARPVGAVIFGHYADTLGRKRTTIIAVSGFGILSVLMAALPGYEQWGLVAVSLLIALRFIDGIFVGGAYTAANPLAMEYCPKQKRGLYGAVVMTGFPLGYAAIGYKLPIRPMGLEDTVLVRRSACARARDLLLLLRGRVGDV